MVKKVNVVMMVIAFMVVANFGAWAQAVSAEAGLVQPNDRELKLNETKVELAVDDKVELKVVSEKPEEVRVKDEKDARVEWKSSNKDVASVDEKGIVRGLKEGMATITATSGGKEGKCEVTVILKRE